jgi:Flp pilus assembly pilin Flp
MWIDSRDAFMKLLLSTLKRGGRETKGQDLIEYTLMAGFVGVAAAAITPGVATSISTIFSKVVSVMVVAGSQG